MKQTSITKVKKNENPVSSEGTASLCSEYTPSIPFAEWSDHEVNLEKWEIEKDKETYEDKLFTDAQEIHLPQSISISHWSRASQVFPDIDIVLFNDSPTCPDLKACSNHLLHSELVRLFISSVETLYYLGDMEYFHIEHTSNLFVPPPSDTPWRPWHHIYSKCKVGKGSQFHPLLNNSGKYIVRIFWLGCWRKVYIDDFLPICNGNVMLPYVQPSFQASYQTAKQKKSKSRDRDSITSMGRKVVELWPFLLFKALLKIANLSWNKECEIIDFDIIQCLTGWIPNKIYANKFTQSEIWDECFKYSRHYTYPPSKILNKSTKSGDKFPIATSDSKKNIIKKRQMQTDLEHSDNYLMACFKRNPTQSTWTHNFLIVQTRDIPFNKPTELEDYPPWKRIRWVEWAAKKGLIPPLKSDCPIRSFKVLDPFADMYQDLRKNSQVDIEETDKKIDASDQTFWIDYELLADNLDCLIVYFKPSCYDSKIRVSNIQFGQGLKQILHPYVLQFSRNEPLYLFTDSDTEKSLIINLSQTGWIDSLESYMIENKKEESKIQEVDSECGICLNALLDRAKSYKYRKELLKVETPKEECVSVFLEHVQHVAHIVIGIMYWFTDNQDDYVASLRTVGSKTLLLSFPPGRYIFRIWITSDTSYVLEFLSKTPFALGTWEDILSSMTDESILFKIKCKEFGESFDALLKSFGKSDFIDRLKTFWKSYKPNCSIPKDASLLIHNVFYKELFTMLNRNHIEDIFCLKILLMQWQLGASLKCAISDLALCYPIEGEEIELLNLINEAATKIQALFKGIYERSMMKLHSPENKKHKKILDSLKKIYTEFFSGDKKVENSAILLRSFFSNSEMKELKYVYDYFRDVEETLTLYDFPGSIKISEKEITFICRQTFYINVDFSVIVKINLFCDLTRYMVRVFDNDSHIECCRYIENVCVGIYKPNISGYTILCYGWSNVGKNLNYTLSLVVEKYSFGDVLIFNSYPYKSEIFKNIYIPNVYHRICRYLLYAMSEYIVMSVFFTTNLHTVDICLKLMEIDGKELQTVYGKGSAVIPAIILNNTEMGMRKTEDSNKNLPKKSSKKSTKRQSVYERPNDNALDAYVIEAYVINNSWPLNASEWIAVERAKTDQHCFSNISVRSDMSKSKKKSVSPDPPPMSVLEVVVNFNDLLECTPDKKREYEIREMKLQWIENAPNRHSKSVKYREEYLNEKSIRNTNIINPAVRILNSKYFKSMILPPYNIQQYFKQHDQLLEKERIYKSPELLEQEYQKEQNDIEMFTNQHEIAIKALDEFVQRNKSTLNSLRKWFSNCKDESEKTMNNVMHMKDLFIMSILGDTKPHGHEKSNKKNIK